MPKRRVLPERDENSSLGDHEQADHDVAAVIRHAEELASARRGGSLLGVEYAQTVFNDARRAFNQRWGDSPAALKKFKKRLKPFLDSE